MMQICEYCINWNWCYIKRGVRRMLLSSSNMIWPLATYPMLWNRKSIMASHSFISVLSAMTSYFCCQWAKTVSLKLFAICIDNFPMPVTSKRCNLQTNINSGSWLLSRSTSSILHATNILGTACIVFVVSCQNEMFVVWEQSWRGQWYRTACSSC